MEITDFNKHFNLFSKLNNLKYTLSVSKFIPISQ